MKNRALFFFILVSLGGCTITYEGIGFYIPNETPKEEYQQRRAQLYQNAREAGLPEPSADNIGYIFIGSAGTYRHFDESNVEDYYEDYLKVALKYREDHKPYFDLASFQKEYSGWATIHSVVVPGLMKVYVKALVPHEHTDSVEFASGFSSIMVGDTDDFVVTRTNPDGAFYVTKLLCPDDSNFYKCIEPYASGSFDQLTGQEVDMKTGKPEDDGRVIDLMSFQEIK